MRSASPGWPGLRSAVSVGGVDMARRPKPLGLVQGIRLCPDDSCDRVKIEWVGFRHGSYVTNITQDEAVTLRIKLEAEVRRIAEAKGYTCPSWVRLLEARRNRQII